MATSSSPTTNRPETGGVRIVGEVYRTALWLWGEHDLSTVHLLGMALVDATADGRDVVVDLREVTFMDASTVGCLLNGRKLLSTYGRRLSLRDPSAVARELLELVGLADLIETARPAGRPAGTVLESWVEVPTPTGVPEPVLDGPERSPR